MVRPVAVAPLRAPGERPAIERRRRSILATLWWTYGSFYFCRANISPAVPSLLAEFRLTKADMGYVLGGTKLAYALGQAINGQLANRIHPRRMLAAGMGLTIALNVLFGFSTGFSFMLVVWFLNGYAQSMGWPPTVRVMAHWFPLVGRGRAMGILGTSYQVTSAATLWGAGLVIVHTGGWRSAFWLPAALVAAVLVYMYRTLQASPEEAFGDAGERQAGADVSLGEGLRAALRNPRIWLFGVVLGAVDIVRYGFLDWAPTLVKELQGVAIDSAALKAAVVPLGGAVGAVASGWVSDRFFGGRRAPVVCLMLVALAVVVSATGLAVASGTVATVALFGLVGFLVYGPQVMVVGALPQDFSSRAVVAGATGFVNAMGYLGAWVGDVVTGKLAHGYGWGASLAFWNLTAAVAALLMATLWRRRPAEEPRS